MSQQVSHYFKLHHANFPSNGYLESSSLLSNSAKRVNLGKWGIEYRYLRPCFLIGLETPTFMANQDASALTRTNKAEFLNKHEKIF